MSSGFRFSDKPGQMVMPEVLSAVHYDFVPPDCITYHYPKVWILNYPLLISNSFIKPARLDKWLPVRPHQSNLLPPRCEWDEDYRTCTDKMCHSNYIMFSPGQYEDSLRELCANSAGFCQFEDNENILGVRMHEIADLATGGEARFLAVNGVLNLILDLLLNFSTVSDKADYRRTITGNRSPELKNMSLAESLTRIFNENPAAPFSIDYLAARLHISRSTLSHRYSETYGETPMAAITRLRINLCRGLLERGVPVKEIAGECGFCDEFHLMKTFRRVTGRTVGEYRRAIH